MSSTTPTTAHTNPKHRTTVVHGAAGCDDGAEPDSAMNGYIAAVTAHAKTNRPTPMW